MSSPKGPAPSRLHGQVESFARELHALRQRLVSLEDGAPKLHAPPLVLHKPRTGALPPVAGHALPPPDAPWWPRPFGVQPGLRPAPGHRCAGLVQPELSAIAVSVCGLDPAAIPDAIETIVAEQIRSRSFVALFLTDATHHLHLFRHQGLDVELLPAAGELAALLGAHEPEAFLARRLARIRDTWGIASYRDLGARPLPWPVRSRPDLRPLHRLFFHKDYRRHNPYQHLLYFSMPDVLAQAGTLDEAIAAQSDGRVAFHLNWEEALYRDAETEAEAVAIVASFVASLDDFCARGGRLIWTLHNETPHDDLFPQVYRTLAQAVARRAGLCLVHSARAGEIAVAHGLDPAALCLLPHGGYHKLYVTMASQAQARRALGLPQSGLLFGFVGGVRPYKNVPLLVEAFDRSTLPGAHLLVAGRHHPPVDIPSSDRVIWRPELVPEAEISNTIRACDAVVLPFDQILTSGSMMLVLSHAVPVIVPAHPSLSETIFDGVNGLTFAPGDAERLSQTLESFAGLSPAQRADIGARGRISAELADWDWIGRSLGQRIARLLA